MLKGLVTQTNGFGILTVNGLTNSSRLSVSFQNTSGTPIDGSFYVVCQSM